MRGGPGLRNLTRTTLDGEREGRSHILYCIVLYINSGILFEDRSGGRCRCRRHLFLRHLYLESLPRTYFSPRQHGTVQARASTATARPGAAPDHDQDRQARPWRPSRPSQAGPAAGPGVRLLAPGAGAGTGLPRRTMPGLLGRLLQSSIPATGQLYPR